MKFEKYKKTASDELAGKKEHKGYLFAKLAMTLIFLWSGFFWSGVTVLNFYINMTFDAHLATLFLTGSIALLVSLILCWCRVYVISMPFTVTGTILFCVAAAEMIAVAEQTAVVFKPSFELRYLPVTFYCIIALFLCIVKLIRKMDEHKRKREEFDNSPAKSILDD